MEFRLCVLPRIIKNTDSANNREEKSMFSCRKLVASAAFSLAKLWHKAIPFIMAIFAGFVPEILVKLTGKVCGNVLFKIMRRIRICGGVRYLFAHASTRWQTAVSFSIRISVFDKRPHVRSSALSKTIQRMEFNLIRLLGVV